MKKLIYVFGVISIAMLLIFSTMAAQSLRIAKDPGGMSTDAIASSDYVLARVMTADSAESITVPAGYDYVMFGCVDGSGNGGSFYADFHGTTAAEPSGDVTDGTGAELNPYIRTLDGITTISVLCPVACIITAAFYQR
jgi:hypothetical protein